MMTRADVLRQADVLDHAERLFVQKHGLEAADASEVRARMTTRQVHDELLAVPVHCPPLSPQNMRVIESDPALAYRLIVGAPLRRPGDDTAAAIVVLKQQIVAAIGLPRELLFAEPIEMIKYNVVI